MSVADEAGAVVSAVYWTNKAGVAVVKGAGRKAKGAHRKAQNIGMAVQNWRHRGAGELKEANFERENMRHRMAYDEVVPAPAKKGSGKNWTTDEESFENTTTSHTTYTRRRTR